MNLAQVMSEGSHDLRDGCATIAKAAEALVRRNRVLVRSGRLHELAHVHNRLLACGIALIVSLLKLWLQLHLDFGFFELRAIPFRRKWLKVVSPPGVWPLNAK